MRLLLTIAGLAPEYGGPSRSVPALAEALAELGVTVEVFSCQPELNQSAPVLPNPTLAPTTLLSPRSRRTQWLASKNDFFRALLREPKRSGSTVIHDNALWLPTNHAVAQAAKLLRVPRVVSPRGMLSAWAIGHHGWKKRVAWTLFQRRDLTAASLFHATSDHEAKELRKSGMRQPIAVIPNGVELPPKRKEDKAKGHGESARTALFLSRIHPVKGLLDLVEAWSRVRPTGWRMVVAGNDEGGHRAEVEAAIHRHGLTSQFLFTGPVRNESKWDLYYDADLFVLPSHSENFGISVAEALACGLPVITTRATPWHDLVQHRAGWWVDQGVESLTETLRTATMASDEDRKEMGQRGRRLVTTDYSWSSAAGKMKAVYQWLLSGGEFPATVLP